MAGVRRVAVIDVGSNSVRLMVADVGERIQVLIRRTMTTRLMSGVVDGRFTPEAIDRTANAISHLVQEARKAGALHVRAFGTSAMRDAQNRQALSDAANMLCGVSISLLSGEEEAQLAYLGAAPSGACGVIDIGGGSTELLIGRDGVVQQAVSVPIGAVRLFNYMAGTFEPGRMVEFAGWALREAVTPFSASGALRWVGVGGTITSLAAMAKRVNKYHPDAIENHPLSFSAVHDWLIRLCAMPIEQRRTLIGLSPSRADIIHCGTAILVSAMKLVNIECVYASDHDNLEGYIRRCWTTPSR